MAATSPAGTVVYEYDALGRLTSVSYPNGDTVDYTLDAAGNRTAVATGGSPTVPSAPASISGPTGQNTTGSYTISWAASTGATRYELWESASAGPLTKVHDGTAMIRLTQQIPRGSDLPAFFGPRVTWRWLPPVWLMIFS